MIKTPCNKAAGSMAAEAYGFWVRRRTACDRERR